jgi:phosphosulfolactate phosphohydrolase-like enzyme
MVYPTNVKVHVLPHLELDEVLSRVKNRWVSNSEHVNHKQYEEDLEWCLKDIEFRYLKEYKQQNLITEI